MQDSSSYISLSFDSFRGRYSLRNCPGTARATIVRACIVCASAANTSTGYNSEYGIAHCA
jgi:hypothetical protein